MTTSNTLLPPAKTETCTVQKRQLPFDWNAFLEKYQYTPEELIYADRMAQSWVTCACGNQCAIVPRNEEGAPENTILFYLGIEFAYRIRAMSLDKITHRTIHKTLAIKNLKEIERVSAQLIAEILGEENINL